MTVNKNNTKVYLRKLQKTDLPTTLAWMQRPDIYIMMGIKSPVSAQSQEKWFENLQTRTDKIVFAVCLKSNDSHVGNVSLDQIDLYNRNARMSIFLAEKEQRGEGLGSDALMLLLTYAFEDLGLHRVYVKMEADNPQLLDFYKKHGFRNEGRLVQHEIKNGKFVDKQIAAVLRPDWILLLPKAK
jgi:RimJ/RimL family protein N-acetyltransferase